MPTVKIEAGLHFDMYAPDHAPPHVHVFDGIEEAVLTLAGQELMYPTRIKAKRLKLACLVVQNNLDFFLAQWNKRNA
jgi:hypothetical protein